MSLDHILYIPLVGILLWASYIDIKERVIYDWNSLIVLVIGFVSTLIHGTWKDMFLGIVVALFIGLGMKVIGFLLYGRKMKDMDYGFGDGDLLLLITLGTVFGLQIIPLFFWTLIISCVVSGVLILLKRASRETALPFVPFMTLGVLLTVIFQPDVNPIREILQYLLAV